MTEEQAKKIMAALNEKGAARPCPRCGSVNFEIVGGVPVLLNEEFTQIKFSGSVIPAVVIGCNHCGYMFNHSLHHLGFPNGLP